jgi:hypothetical protein
VSLDGILGLVAQAAQASLFVPVLDRLVVLGVPVPVRVLVLVSVML